MRPGCVIGIDAPGDGVDEQEAGNIHGEEHQAERHFVAQRGPRRASFPAAGQ